MAHSQPKLNNPIRTEFVRIGQPLFQKEFLKILDNYKKVCYNSFITNKRGEKMTEIYSNPVDYSVSEQAPGDNYFRVQYKAYCLIDEKAVYNHGVWVKSWNDFYKLLAYWNRQGGYIWKYTE